MTFHKVLVANRGEIALRVIEACREQSLESVAVFSQADERMPYLRLATEAICIGPADPAKSYLSIPAVLSAAVVSRAQAIHPGYGFLSENPHFVEVCEGHGLTFVGPDKAAMELAGNKWKAREAVALAGVPILPGERLAESSNGWEEAGDRVGYPLLVKALFGGGGRGIRLVKDRSGLAAAVSLARREAGRAFGVPDVYLERALSNPRHIEVQILGDYEGRVLHVGERECSIQRRHQKLIEEAPAPSLDQALRTRLRQAAVAAGRAIGYRNAGTVEFLLDERGEFFFMELNARIQVEHPVTEMIAGMNLVALQLRLAAGGSLAPFGPEIGLSGHAIECRINAEDPDHGFLPSCGRVEIDELPGGVGIRVDTHLWNGMEVVPHYDSLLAKIIAWGRDREESRTRMYTALERFRIRGVATTRSLAQEVISHPAFREERAGTGFLDELLSG